MTAALVAKKAGLNVIVIEKTGTYGGSTALSGGGIWVPNNYLLEKNGVQDSIEKAKEYLTKSSLPEASLLYALCLKKEGKEKEASASLLQLRGKVDGLAYTELAKILIDRKDFASALKNLEEASKFRRAEAEAHYLTGKILLDTGKEEEALKTLLKVRYLHPESEWVSPSLYLLSEIMIKKGEKERALTYLKDIVARNEDPWSTKAKNKISELNK